MPAPKFPDDFRVLYAEGASYWWWSPFTGPEYDGTWPSKEEPPCGLMVGSPDYSSHELNYGEVFEVIWTNFGDVHLPSDEYEYVDDARVTDAVLRHLGWLASEGHLVNLGDVYTRPSSVPS